MTQALYAHMNNKRKIEKKKELLMNIVIQQWNEVSKIVRRAWLNIIRYL
jgi:hypothetical protein